MRGWLALCVVWLAACQARPQPSAAEHGAQLRAADAGKPRADCYACHARDYRSAQRHEGVKPTRCAVCHLETGWHPTQRNHPWPLSGAHETADCLACHTGNPPVYEDLPGECVDCHRADYDKSEYPGHDRFALTCADCHGTQAWKPAKKPEKQARPAEVHAGIPSEARPRAPTVHSRPVPSVPQPRAAARPDPSDSAQPPEPAPAPEPRAAQPSAAGRKHPESAFPITTGNHTDIDCETCHDGPGRNGKDNSDCVQCHKRSRFDRRHARVADYPAGDAAPNFCVECHTRGTRATRAGR